jgi:hypothetical protein
VAISHASAFQPDAARPSRAISDERPETQRFLSRFRAVASGNASSISHSQDGLDRNRPSPNQEKMQTHHKTTLNAPSMANHDAAKQAPPMHPVTWSQAEIRRLVMETIG